MSDVKFFWDYRGTGSLPERLVPLEYIIGDQLEYIIGDQGDDKKLGRKGNEKELGLQNQYLSRKIRGDPYNFLIFAEHEPVYSCPHNKIKGLVDSNRFLKKPGENLPAKFVRILEKRGGSLTYHGPGQLTCYLIICLEELNIKGQRQLAVLIDEIIKQTLLEFGVRGVSVKEIEGNNYDVQEENHLISIQGIWVLNNLGQIKKIASQGLRVITVKTQNENGDAVFRHFTKFGFSINVSTDLSYFSHIYPCGMDIEMTSIRQLIDGNPPLTDVAKTVAKVAEEKFQTLVSEK